MMTEEGRDAAAEAIRSFGIEGLIVGGGDGSFHGARTLTRRGIPCIGLPCTIDNDLAYTDVTIGFDTACNTAIAATMNIRDTMTSHDRFAVVEVMGRHRGDIALMVGLAVGADEILIPESCYTQPFDFDNVVNRMKEIHAAGAKTGLIVLSEGVEYENPRRCEQLAQRLEDATGMEFRAAVLGHIQRGGRPTMRDRVLAIRTAARAVELIHNGVSDRVVGMRAGVIIDCDIYEALQVPRPTHSDLLKLALTLGGR
jgi:6-phosphofructokinase 1